MSTFKKITKKAITSKQKPYVGTVEPEDDTKKETKAAIATGFAKKTEKATKVPKEKKEKKPMEPKKPTANKIIAEMILAQKSSINEIVAAVKKAGLETECPTTTKCRCVLFNLGKAGNKDLKLFNREGTKLVEFVRTKKEKPAKVKAKIPLKKTVAARPEN